jgi:hypothetical protein
MRVTPAMNLDDTPTASRAADQRVFTSKKVEGNQENRIVMDGPEKAGCKMDHETRPTRALSTTALAVSPLGDAPGRLRRLDVVLVDTGVRAGHLR